MMIYYIIHLPPSDGLEFMFLTMVAHNLMMQDLSSPKEKGTDRWVTLQQGRYYSKYKQVQL